MTSIGVPPALAIRHLADLKFIVAMPSVFVANRGVITLRFQCPRSSPLASVIKRQREMIEPKYDFSKIYLTNGLTATNDHRGHRRPALTAVVLVIAMGIAWYFIS